MRTRIDDAAAGVEDRPLRLGDHVDRGADRRWVALGARMVGLVAAGGRRRVGAGRELDVLGDVDDHRPGPAMGGDVEGLMQDPRQIVDVADQPVVLGAGTGDPDGIALLEGIVADQMGGDLPGDADHRDRVHQRIGERGDEVGGARPGGNQRHAGLAGRAGVAFGGMAGALLVTNEDVLDRVLLDDLVIDREDRAPRIPEYVLDTLIDQGLDDHLGARHLLVHVSHLEPPAAAGS